MARLLWNQGTACRSGDQTHIILHRDLGEISPWKTMLPVLSRNVPPGSGDEVDPPGERLPGLSWHRHRSGC